MFVSHEDEISKKELSAETLRGVSKQILVGPQEGWQDYVMRQMHLEIEGYTPHHRHDWPHINYVTGGRGTVLVGTTEYPVRKGSVAYVPAGTEHQFRADQGEELSFLCIVPKEGEG
ncbi:MAG: cupin domain-containing protein [Spirochaetales bacterium]|nr:cupin domain-containing protein [Spirochaetales bacterium]MCF7939648.1 cupin domain-containing protein [Spirochaetales bacterium]